MSSIIELQNVVKVYTTRQRPVRALDGLSLAIEDGEFVAIRGPSGCGKSTLLALIGGLAQPTSGEVRVCDQVVSSMSSAERARFRAGHVGFVFQLFHLLPYLSVIDNIRVACRPEHGEEDARFAGELVQALDLQDRETHRPSQLSAGERQRVALARALVARPKVLLADEPTGNLDPGNADVVLGWLERYHQDYGGTVVLVTHDERAAGRAGRTVRLAAGQVVEPPCDVDAPTAIQ